MMNNISGMLIDPMQSMRITKHPIPIKENLIINDNLEAGALRIYEPSGGAVSIQQLFSNYQSIHNAVPVAEITINSLWKDNGVFIHSISCEQGYENLIPPMICQVLHFSKFYDRFCLVGMSEAEYEKWMPYAKETLSNFRKHNRVYEYTLNGQHKSE